MKYGATAVALLLLASVLPAQDALQPSTPLRFLLVLPNNVPIEAAQIQYFPSGPQGGGASGSFLKPEPRLHAYGLNPPGTEVKVMAYLPGCQFITLNLTRDMPTTQALACRPLRSVNLSGRESPTDVLAGRTTFVEVRYLARWGHYFFGIMDGMVPMFKVATAAPSADGTFKVSLPDFADDAAMEYWKNSRCWWLLLRDVGTLNILALLKAPESLSDGMGKLEVRSSYPGVVTFTAVPN